MAASSVSPALQVPSNIDYTSKDFVSFMQSMMSYAGQVMPQWNTSSEGDMGVALLEMTAYCMDILSYYGDRISQESYLPTATQRLSLLNIAQLLGYTVSNGTPATGTVTFQTANPNPAVLIAAGTQVATNFNTSLDSPVIYETDATITCPGNGGTVTVGVSQGVTYSYTPVGTSTGLPAQEFSLPQTGIIDGTVEVFVQTAVNPQQWTYVQYLADSGPSATVFTTFLDASGLTWIEFGDNENGIIPSQGLTIYATYRVGAGSAGNVAAGIVGEIVNPIDGLSIPLAADGVTFDSSEMSGGADPETNDQIRANAPQVFATQQRAISPSDFQAMAQNVQGVTVATAVAAHSTAVTIYALGPDYLPAEAGLQADILAYFAGRTMAGVTVVVSQPALVAIDVGSPASPVQLQVRAGYLQASVVQNVQTALTALFQPPNVSFGQLLTVGQVYQTIMDTDGVDWVVVPVFARSDVTQTGTANIQLRGSEVASPGTFTIQPSGGF
jgi:uncharacterized phage protein gp47/JayE